MARGSPIVAITVGIAPVAFLPGFLDSIGRDCVFEAKDDAIRAIYARLESSRCRTCDVRIFTECESTLPDGSRRES